MDRFLFTPLDTPKTRTGSFVAGWGIQIALVAVLLSLNALFPKALPQISHTIAVSLVPYEAPVNHTPQVRMKPQLAPFVKPVIVATAPTPRPRVEEVVPPEVHVTADVPKIDNPAPVIPKQPVVLNTLNTGSSAPQTTHKPAIQVQTGGFGDPNGIPAKGDGKHAVNIAAAGSFDLPQGEGHGNGTGGRHGVPQVTASTGFGNGTATGGPGRHVEMGASNFDNHQVTENKTVALSKAPTIPAQILAKPEPKYTEEARNLRIEGAVRVEVVLAADGRVEILNVLNGLGHGLDEQAVAVARQIKFKPAQREGQSTDSTVVISIIFALAS